MTFENSINHQTSKLQDDHRFAEGSKRQDALEIMLESTITEFLRNGEKMGSEFPHLKSEILQMINKRIKLLS